MITLITGHTGSGKTAYAVNFILEAIKEDKYNKIFTNIKVNVLFDKLFYHDDVYFKEVFEKLALIMENNPNQENAKEALKKTDYVNCLFVLDEVHFMGFREQNKYLNDFLTIHRHIGVDLILITQTPKNIWSKHLDLVHIHIQALPSSNRLLPNSLQYRIYEPYGSKEYQLKLFKPPKDLFLLYRSGKKEFRVNKIVVKILLLLFVLFLLLFYAYKSFSDFYKQTYLNTTIKQHKNTQQKNKHHKHHKIKIIEKNKSDISDFKIYYKKPKNYVYCEETDIILFKNFKKTFRKGYKCLTLIK